MKAPEADSVKFNSDILRLRCRWRRIRQVSEHRLSEYLFETFRYCFIVDGTPVADPSNMYLSPDLGFKYSIADNPNSPYNLSQGDIEHGRVADLDQGEAWYIAHACRTAAGHVCDASYDSVGTWCWRHNGELVQGRWC